MNSMNYAQFDAATLEGLVLLARERMALAAQQVPGILDHIAEHQAHIEEQQMLVERFKAQYDIDDMFVQGAIDFIQRGGQPQRLPQPPQMQQQFQPTHQFPPFPQPALPQHLPQPQAHQAQQFQGPPGPPGYQPPQFQAPQQQHPQPPYPQQQAPSRVVQGQGQPPFPQQAPQQAGDGGVTPLPFGQAEAASATMAVTGSRRSHLMPNPNGPGFIPNPDFVDEYGMRPVTEITEEMREAWKQDQKPEVLVIMPGEEGHVPPGGANLKVKVRGTLNESTEQVEGDIEMVPENVQPS